MIYLFNFLVIELKKNTQENTQEMATSPIKKRMKMYLKYSSRKHSRNRNQPLWCNNNISLSPNYAVSKSYNYN